MQFLQSINLYSIYLMDNTTIPISEIATILSFTDQSHFIKTFKKVTGKTPMKLKT